MIAKDQRGVEEIRPRWERLRRESGRAAPNTDPDRYLATLKALGPGVGPHVAEFAEGQGVLVAREQTRRSSYRLGYLNIPSPKLRCLDIVYEGVVTPDEPGMADAACNYLQGLLSADFDLITFNHVRLDSPLMARLRELGGELDVVEPHWVLPLVPRSFDKTLEHRTGKHRGNLRRMDKKLCEHFSGEVAVREFTRPEEVGEFLGLCAGVTALSYHGAIGAGVVDNVLWRSILQAEATAGRWIGFVLIAKGDAIAYDTGVVYGTTYHLEATSYLPEHRALGPGSVLLMRVIKELCDRDLTSLDFGFGDAEYKQSNGTLSWNEASVRLYGRSLRARGTKGLGGLAVKMSSLPVARKMAPRVKRLWRRVLTRGGGGGV
jgi:hypothetical protein